MNKRMYTVCVLATLLALVLAACGGGSGAGGNAQETVCKGLTGMTAAVDKLSAASAETTTKDVKELKKQLDGAVQALKTANQLLNAERVTQLIAAYDGLAKTVDALPDDAPLGEASAQLQSGVQGMKAALDQATSTLKCSQ